MRNGGRKTSSGRLLSTDWNGMEKNYMTLQVSYQEKFEQGLKQGLERGKTESAKRMLESGRLSMEEIAAYSGLAVQQVYELKKEM